MNRYDPSIHLERVQTSPDTVVLRVLIAHGSGKKPVFLSEGFSPNDPYVYQYRYTLDDSSNNDPAEDLSIFQHSPIPQITPTPAAVEVLVYETGFQAGDLPKGRVYGKLSAADSTRLDAGTSNDYDDSHLPYVHLSKKSGVSDATLYVLARLDGQDVLNDQPIQSSVLTLDVQPQGTNPSATTLGNYVVHEQTLPSSNDDSLTINLEKGGDRRGEATINLSYSDPA